MPYIPPISQRRTRSVASRPTIQPQQDGRGRQLSHFLNTLEDVIRAKFTARSLYVQIGVLNFQSLTIANATGEPQTSVSLTLAMPHGPLFLMHRFRGGLSQSASPTVEESILILPPDMELVHKYHKTWEVRKANRQSWWRSLIQG